LEIVSHNWVAERRSNSHCCRLTLYYKVIKTTLLPVWSCSESPDRTHLDSRGAVPLHIRQEDIVLIGCTLVTCSNLPNKSMFAYAIGELGFVVCKTPA